MDPSVAVVTLALDALPTERYSQRGDFILMKPTNGCVKSTPFGLLTSHIAFSPDRIISKLKGCERPRAYPVTPKRDVFDYLAVLRGGHPALLRIRCCVRTPGGAARIRYVWPPTIALADFRRRAAAGSPSPGGLCIF